MGKKCPHLIFLPLQSQPMPHTGQTHLQVRGQGCLVKHLLLKQARKGGEQHEGTSEESTTPGMCGFIRGIHSSFSPLDS